jgi:hypothetical protein
MIKIDLVKAIEQAVEQVWGSDERDLLHQWLARNSETEQIVKVDLAAIIRPDNSTISRTYSYRPPRRRKRRSE